MDNYGLTRYLKIIIVLMTAGIICFSHPVLAAQDHTTQPIKKHTTHKHHTQKSHHKKKPKHAPLANHQAADPNDLDPREVAETSYTQNITSIIKQHLIDMVHKTVTTLRYSVYKLGGSRFDTSHGVYVIDCSSYVDHILRAVYPNAYSNLVDSSRSYSPTSKQYYDFFRGLADTPESYWNKIDDASDLQPGDILVFRDKIRADRPGHVMIVMDKPIHEADVLFVRVADSAPVGHSEDTRPPHVSGIGIGTLLLKVNPRTGQPSAYAWRMGAQWKQGVNFAMGRPMEIQPGPPQYYRSRYPSS